MKKLGAKKIAAVGYGVSPSSSESAKATQKYAAPASGLKPVYLNTRSTSAAPTSARSCSASRTRAPTRVYLPLDGDTNFAIAQGLQQNGVKMKATS